jgi:hypothetical protein
MPTAVHGKEHYISVGTKDLTTYTKTHNFEDNPDIHDISGCGTDDKSFRGGQKEKSLTIGGWYDVSETTGPAYLATITGSTVAFERRVNGTGSGLPKQTGNVVVGKYVESGKNDDIVQWTCDLKITGAVVRASQT